MDIPAANFEAGRSLRKTGGEVTCYSYIYIRMSKIIAQNTKLPRHTSQEKNI
jgi:hypothetical protein